MKKHLIDINGFNEDYLHACVGEDNDVDWRLRSSGVKRKSVKNKAIVYHIFHEKGYSKEGMYINKSIMNDCKKLNTVFCKNGLINNDIDISSPVK